MKIMSEMWVDGIGRVEYVARVETVEKGVKELVNGSAVSFTLAQRTIADAVEEFIITATKEDGIGPYIKRRL